MTAKTFANHIAGSWVTGYDTAPNINPSELTDTIGHYALGSADDVFQAVDAASTAFKTWSKSTSLMRAEALDKIGTEIVARKDELGDMLAREEGKTLREATGRSASGRQSIQIFCQPKPIAKQYPGFRSIRENVELEVRREPIGVVGVITPWNFPLAIPAWKIAPALAYGNTVVFKPAELVPGSAWLLSDIISRAGLPAGVFNLVMGHGHDVGQAIVDHPNVAGVSFTGSTRLAKDWSALFQRGRACNWKWVAKTP